MRATTERRIKALEAKAAGPARCFDYETTVRDAPPDIVAQWRRDNPGRDLDPDELLHVMFNVESIGRYVLSDSDFQKYCREVGADPRE